MALAAHYDLKLHQMNAKNSFSNLNLDEEFYMIQLGGFKKREMKSSAQIKDTHIWGKASFPSMEFKV